MALLFSYLPPVKSTFGRPLLQKRFFCHLSCDKCDAEFDLRYEKIQKHEKQGLHLCESCLRSYVMSNRSTETKQKLSNSLKGKPKSLTHRKNLSLSISGEKHPQFGKHEWRGKNQNYNKHLENWKGKTFNEIFGIEKSKSISEKLSFSRMGEKNPMFGKPSPTGSGNGWSGWFKEKYFRSLLELSFMIQNPFATSAEGIRIPYINHEGLLRNYFPDFSIGELVIEVKPKKLISTINNRKKFEAARKLFGDKFQVMTEEDTIQLTFDDLRLLIDSGDVKFIDRYQTKYEALIEKSSNSVL